ncbi:MAG: aminopeptidase [Chloroflexi bacterium]|nr:aminopeptidase [Chloroflexota bacterium]
MDPRVQRMAEVLVNYSIAVEAGDWVVIQSPLAGEPLAVECVRAVLKAGGHPTTLYSSEDGQRVILAEGSDEQLSFVPPFFTVLIERADATIAVLAPTNTRALSTLDPRRMALQQKSMEPLMDTFMRRSASGELRWTGGQFPTHAAAQDAGMSLREYEDFVYDAGLLNEPDPALAWKQLGERQARIIDWLKDRRMVHVTGPGTDLRVSVAGRTWENDDGHKNFPGGEVFTGPVEDSAQGVIQFTFPAYLAGREVSGVRLVFEAGRVVEATATGDEAFLHQMLDMDEGARRLGELAFGTNPGIQRFSKNTLFDEKIGGTLHMALGRSYPETGGRNVSALHWDMVYDLRDGAEVRVDDQLFSKNGEIESEVFSL